MRGCRGEKWGSSEKLQRFGSGKCDETGGAWRWAVVQAEILSSHRYWETGLASLLIAFQRDGFHSRSLRKILLGCRRKRHLKGTEKGFAMVSAFRQPL